MDLVRTNDLDTGSISNSSFQGGSIELFGGPWTISGKQGARARRPETYSPAAFALHSPHDVIDRGQSGHAIRPRRPRVSPGESGGLGLRQRHRGQHVRRRRRARSATRSPIPRRTRPVLWHQRSRGHPGRKHLRRLVRGKARRGLGRRPASRLARPEGVGVPPARPGPGWSSRFWPESAAGGRRD